MIPKWLYLIFLWFVIGESTGFGKGIYDWMFEKLMPNSAITRYLQYSGTARQLPVYWPRVSSKTNNEETYVYYQAIHPAEAAKNSHLLEKRVYKRSREILNGDKFKTG